MKKLVRIIFVTSLLFILSGCTARYDLNIKKDNTITETISGKVLKKELDNEGRTDVNAYLYAFELASPLIDEQGEYNKNIVEKRKYKEFTFDYTYRNNFSKSSVLNKCFQNVDYKETEEAYIINLSGEFFCLLPKEIEVNLISDYGVLENNADKVKGNKYTWIIKDTDNIDISAIISKNVMFSKSEGTDILKIIEIIGVSIFLVLIIITYIIYRKKNNE